MTSQELFGHRPHVNLHEMQHFQPIINGQPVPVDSLWPQHANHNIQPPLFGVNESMSPKAPITVAEIEAELLLQRALALQKHTMERSNDGYGNMHHGRPGYPSPPKDPLNSLKSMNENQEGSLQNEDQNAFLRMIMGLQIIPHAGGGSTVVKKASMPMTADDLKAREIWERRRALKEKKLAKMVYNITKYRQNMQD